MKTKKKVYDENFARYFNSMSMRNLFFEVFSMMHASEQDTEKAMHTAREYIVSVVRKRLKKDMEKIAGIKRLKREQEENLNRDKDLIIAINEIGK
jgi:uncharacterized protein YbcI